MEIALGKLSERLDNERFLKKLFSKHMGSAILSMFGAMVSSIANSLLAGMFFGAHGLAVMSATAPIASIFAAIGSLVGVGGSIATGYALGREDTVRANAAFSLSLFSGIALSLFFGGIGCVFLGEMLTLVGCGADLFEDAYRVGTIAFLGGFSTTLYYLPYNFLKLAGKLRFLIQLFLGMATLNILLDILLVQGAGVGIVGIAWGTVLAGAAASLLGIYRLTSEKDGFRLIFSMNAELFRELLCLGTPSAFNNLLIFCRLFLMNQLIASLAGTAGLAIFSVVTALENVSLILIGGLSQATAGFVSVLSKEMDTVSVRRIERQAFRLGFLMILPLMVGIFFFSSEICTLFGIAAAESVPTEQALHIFAFSLIPSLCCYLLFFYYQAAGFATLANMMILAKSFLFFVVPAWIFSMFYGLVGVWYTYFVSAVAAFLPMLFARRFYSAKGYRGWLLQDLRGEQSGRTLSFSVLPCAEEIIKCNEDIERFCRANALARKDVMLVCLAVEEMLVSIAEHCYTSASKGVIDVRIFILPEGERLQTVLRIRSAGKLFHPIEYYEHHKASDPLAMGDALGISMIIKAASAVHYRTTFGINNLTVMLCCAREA